jgi:transposase
MNYRAVIKESLVELQGLEKQQSKHMFKDRVRFMRYLKEGTAQSQAQAGKLIGLQERQSQNLWQLYNRDGLQALLTYRYQARSGKLSYSQISKLSAYLKTDQAATLQQVQKFVSTSFDISYSM